MANSQGKRWLTTGVVGVLALAVGHAGDARDFRCRACDMKAREVERCQRIDPGEYSTAMLMNPPGTQTSFRRSSCLQRLARRYGDASLCREVRERKSIFFDGSSISRENCERRVREELAGRPELAFGDFFRLREVAFGLNGNGRDVDVQIGFSGSYRHRYELVVEMLGGAGAAHEFHRQDRNFGPRTPELRVWIDRAELEAAATSLAVEAPYRFRVTLALVEPSLREVELFAALAREERESSVEQLVDPAELTWTPGS